MSTPEKMIHCGIYYDEWYPVPRLYAHGGDVEYEGEGVMLPAELVHEYVEAAAAFRTACEKVASEDPNSMSMNWGDSDNHADLRAALVRTSADDDETLDQANIRK